MNVRTNPHRLSYKLLIILFSFTIVGFSLLPVCNYFRNHTKDYGKYYQIGQITLHGGDIYFKNKGETFQFMYPPTAAVLLAPLSALGLLPLIVILGFTNSASWIVSVFLSVYLTTGKTLQQHPLLYLVPTVCCMPYVWNTYLLGQPHLLLLVCMLGAFVSLRMKNEWCAGMLIAFAAAIKAFLILAIVYLVYRRHWKATLSTLAFLFFFLVLLPVPLRGFQRNWQDIRTWTNGMALHYEADSIAQRPSRGYSWKNQSLIAVTKRLLRPVRAFQSKSKSYYVNFVTLKFKYVNVIIVIIGFCLFYVTSMPHYAQRTAHTDLIEYAMLLILILIFTPLSFTYFYIWLLYPLTVAFNILLTARNPSTGRNAILIWFSVCLILLGFMFPVPGFDWFEAIGNTFWACVLLLGGLGWKLRRLST
ncbi:MAG: DUF2029 domain-containing protein [Planctomycetota bacterium]|nr:DUF2029 domain-containing protein [Planctomycetota bacterium]MDE2217578.1 DUF2029 domain-containing protein [Planctomycetota bacterium]